MLFAALKDENEGKFSFQTITIELYKQPKRNKQKEHLRLVISSVRVGVVPKTDDEVYVLSTIKYIVTFHLFSLLCQRRSSY